MKKLARRKATKASLIQKPSPSLRIAFWSLITTSGICWTLALLLGSSLLTSCSGSIFSEKSAPAPGGTPPATTDSRNLAPNSSSSSSDGPGRDIEERPLTEEELNARRGRVVTDVAALDIYDLIAPSQVASWTQNMNDRQRLDFLSQLEMDIVIGKAEKRDNNMTLRNVVFYIRKDKKNITNNPKKNYPYASILMRVSQDESDGPIRHFFASGYLDVRDDGAKPLIGLSLRFIKVKNSYVVDDGKLFDYVNGDPQEGFRLTGNSLVRVGIH
ncbi:MAG: hypothetical protein R3A80_04705 [Bdellovibrionota bacterium]